MSAAERMASMTPDELVAVITRGLDEDERAARDAGDETTKWYLSSNDDLFEEPGSPVAIGPWGAGIVPEGVHIARHDPSRVLADVQSKREAIRLYRDTLDIIQTFKSHGHDAKAYGVAAESYLNVLRALARPYLDRDTP